MKIRLLAIDPGNVNSAYVIIDTETYSPVGFAKLENKELLQQIGHWHDQALRGKPAIDETVIETIIASYGQKIGRTTFDTAIMIGRLEQALFSFAPVKKIPRQTVRRHLCPGIRANDRTVRAALIERFAAQDKKRGKGTTHHPDFFYGFANDVWAAFAVGATYLDLKKEETTNR